MGMSNAERQRKFRQNRNSNPQKREEYLQKEKERNAQRKAKGKRKSVKDMTDREKRAVRKQRRKSKRKERVRAKSMNEILTPPNSPEAINVNEPSRQKRQSSKKTNREKAKCYRDNKQLKNELRKQTLLANKYRKRLERQNERTRKLENKGDTPRTKTRKLLRLYPQKTVRKTLIFQSALIEQIKEKYKNKLRKGQKKEIEDILHGSILRKYRLKTAALRALGIRVRNERVKNRNCLSRRMYSSIKDFFERDDVSRMTSGIKNTVTVNKLKKQRRVLNESLKNLHVKFLSENAGKVSYKTFCRLRPYWVTFPRESDRNTCLCKLCNNSELMANALTKANVLSTESLEDITMETVCNLQDQNCMFKTCSECKYKRIGFNTELGNEEIEWEEWQRKTEKRLFKTGCEEQEKDVTFTTKETFIGTVNELCEKFEGQIDRYKRHLFTLRWQFNYLRRRKENLKENECILQADFSENYEGKMPSAVQGMSYGASKKQISLHTGVIYTSTANSSNYTTFCTVSDNLHHGPGGIWAHLRPVLKDIKKKNPKVDSVEFFSDGPTSQYRQKFNFYMLATEVYKLGFRKAEWNFFEAGHGKGVPDAVGGSIKRKADHKVKYGNTIMSAKSFVKTLNESGTKLYEISETEIENTRTGLRKMSPKPVPGTLKLHQLKTSCPGSLLYRELSCECVESNQCKGHELNSHRFQDVQAEAFANLDMKENKAENEINYGKLNQNDRFKNQNINQTADDEMIKKGQNIKTGERMNKISSKKAPRSKPINKVGNITPTNSKIENKTRNKRPRHGKQQTAGSEETTDIGPQQTSEHIDKKEDNKPTKDENSGCMENLGQENGNPVENYPLLLDEFMKCKGFEQLRLKCLEVSKNFKELPTIPQSVNVLSSHLEVDLDAMDLYPNDVPDGRTLYPCTVPADGNCLPSSGSVFAYGCPDFSAEMRLRILCELVLNEETYLDNNFLLQGLAQTEHNRSLAKSYAMYSDMWIPGMLLNDDMIKSIYRMELHKIRVNHSFMGMWQIHALSSVLKVPIYAIYPQKSSPQIRRDLNRLVLPRQGCQNQTPVYIAWTSNRDAEMVHDHWTPNHFVPCLPVDEDSTYAGISMRNISMRNPEASKNACEKVTDDKVEIIDLTEGVTTAQSSGCKRKKETLNSDGNGERGANKKVKIRRQSQGEGCKVESVSSKVGTEENDDSQTRTEHNNIVTHDSEIETRDNMTEAEASKAMTEDSSREAENQKKDINDTNVETDNFRIETEDGLMKTRASQIYTDDIKTDENKIDKGTKMDTENNKRAPRDSNGKMETKDDDIAENGRNSMEKKNEEDNKLEKESENIRLETEDRKGIDERRKKASMETTDFKININECKVETEDSGEKQNEFDKQEEICKIRSAVRREETENSQVVTDIDEMENTIPQPMHYIGKYVVVKYGKHAYPGIVEDAGEYDVYVKCMHSIGRKNRNCFFWPKKLVDRCWYDHENILAVIPEPTKLTDSHSHYKVEESVWESVIEVLNKK